MNCAPKPIFGTTRAGDTAAFTLAEVLAALVFMAIVIPVAIQGLRVASLAGEVAQRKSQAARIADRILNESIVTTNWSQAYQRGSVTEGSTEFNWTLRNDAWGIETLRLVSVEVQFPAQGKSYSVKLSTVADNSLPNLTTTSQP
jgi:type II secretory pathway pseudopilin PulG